MQGSFDLTELIRILLKRLWFIVLVSIIGFLVSYGYTKIILKPVYTSSVKLYVSNAKLTEQQERINYNDISAAQQLVDTYAIILQSNQVLSEVISAENLSYSPAQLRRMLVVSSLNDTEVMEVYVTTDNPQMSAVIANAIAEISPAKIKQITKAGAVELVDKAEPSLNPSSPNTNFNCLMGVMVGLLFSVLAVIFNEMFDMHIKGIDDIKKRYAIPILGSIPVLNSNKKGSFNYER